jgi:hypothetical protein
MPLVHPMHHIPQAVLGKSVRLRTRYAYDCVLDRLSWDSPIWLTHEAEGELKLWLENIEKMNFEGQESL